MPSFLFLLLSLSFFSLPNGAFAKSSEMVFPATSIKSLSVSSPKGNIQINGSGTNKDVIVKITDLKPTAESAKCVKNMGLEGTKLVVSVSNENGLFDKATCEFEIVISFNQKTLSLPGSAISVSSASADMSLKNVSSELDLKTASGKMTVLGDQLRNVIAKSATGEQHFAFKNCPSRADVDLMTGTGDMILKMPVNCKIRVDFKSATGKLFNPIGESEDYQVKIVGKSASGDLTLGKL